MNPKDDDEKIIAGHEYDGIHELDNPLPNWWLMTFYITVVFALIYFAYYSVGSGPSLHEELEQQMARLQKRAPPSSQAPWPDESRLLAFSKDPGQLKNGEGTFQARCVSCHGTKGEGIIGPNLTDHFWIHGKGTLPDIARVIKEGVNEKGMPSWGALLKDDEIYAVAVYVKSLEDSHPPNAKAPQGDEVKEKEKEEE